MRTTRKQVWHVLAAVVCSVLPAGAQADDPPAKPIKEVSVDLAAHAFVQVLPFDVPFFITGVAPPRTRQIRVSIQETLKNGTAPKTGPVVPFPWDAAELSDANVPFRILIPQLQAEKFYRFRFDLRRTLNKEEVEGFQKLALPVLEQGMRTLELADGELKPEDSSALRKSLSTLLRQLMTKNEVLAEGTVFDLERPHEDVLNQFNLVTRNIIAPQDDRGEAVISYTALQSVLRTALDGMRADAALDRAAALIESSTDGTIVTALGQWRAGLDLARLDDAQAAARANGTGPGAKPTLELRQAWTVTDAEPFAANYRRTQSDLDALRQLLEAALPLLPALSAADRAAVQALLAGKGAIREARTRIGEVLNAVGRVRSDLAERTGALEQLAALVIIEGQKVLIVEGTSVADFRTAQSWYIAMDAGFAYAFRIGTMTPYVGANIYFRPVNKDASFSLADSFGRRFAVTFGITLSSIEEEAGDETALTTAGKTRFDLLTNNRSLLLGAGFRVSPSLRLSGGVLVLKERDPNPLISTISIATVPYVSFSLDFDIASGLKGGLGALFGSSENK